jgi:hypothetical protein
MINTGTKIYFPFRFMAITNELMQPRTWRLCIWTGNQTQNICTHTLRTFSFVNSYKYCKETVWLWLKKINVIIVGGIFTSGDFKFKQKRDTNAGQTASFIIIWSFRRTVRKCFPQSQNSMYHAWLHQIGMVSFHACNCIQMLVVGEKKYASLCMIFSLAVTKLNL